VAATHNAVADALAHLGLGRIDLPLTPLRIWEALQQATLQQAGSTGPVA
jgi:carbon-monoxide dehydrogenase large subunit